VSVFRPSARATSPDGREWEIYAYKIQLDERPPAPGIWADDYPMTALANVVSAGHSVFYGLFHAVRRVLVDIPVASVRAVRSDRWTIDAVSWMPRKTTYRWTTTREFRGQVLAQIEGHLTRGDVPQHLTNATYRGAC
jgi:hypothetical protein